MTGVQSECSEGSSVVPRSRSTRVDTTTNGTTRFQDLLGRCVAVIPGEMEGDQTRCSLEYMSSYTQIGIQLIEVVEDLVGVVFNKTTKVKYPLYRSLVPVGGGIADFISIMMGSCITTVDVRDQEAVRLEGISVMNLGRNHAHRLTGVSNERVVLANGLKASIRLRVGELQYAPTHWATLKGKLWGRPCGILPREVYPTLVILMGG